MKILLIHRYFWPDTPPYASILRAIGEHLVREGNSVSVFSSQPSYKPNINNPIQPEKEILNGISVTRMDLSSEKRLKGFQRVLNILKFAFGAFFFILKNKPYDIVMASTTPPVLVGFFCCLACKIKGSKFIYHIMDIQPEVGKISGEFRNWMIFNLLKGIDSLTCNMAEKIVVLSHDMAQTIRSRKYCKSVTIEVINNFTLPSYDNETNLSKKFIKSHKFRIIFAGNIGRFQGLETIIQAMHILDKRNEKIELVLLGEGDHKKKLKSMSKDLIGKSIIFLDHCPVSMAKKIIQNSDIGLVSLRASIQKYAYPSKFMTYLSEGCPLLISVDNQCELTDFVNRKNIGICVTEIDEYKLADAILNIYQQPEIYRKMKENVKNAANIFEKENLFKKWNRLILCCSDSIKHFHIRTDGEFKKLR